jgi:hypothetical protein
MRFFIILVGSITIGAALALSLTEFAALARVLVGITFAVLGVVLWLLLRHRAKVAARYVYTADSEAERYTVEDIREVFHALTEAKAKSAAPFVRVRVERDPWN